MMNNKTELIEWSRIMGYNGNIPNSFEHVDNKSTWFIWDTLVQNVRPIEEAEKIKNNIIINRLKCKPINEQDEFDFSIKEIELYQRKKMLRSKLEILKMQVKEKELKAKHTFQENSRAYLSLDKFRSQIDVKKIRKALLKKKSEMLNKNVKDCEEMLTQVKNLTPVEAPENPDTKDITKTLKQCAEKLEKHLRQLPHPQTVKTNVNHDSVTSLTKTFIKIDTGRKQFLSCQSKNNQTHFEQYVSLTERKNIQISSHGNKTGNIENILNNRKSIRSNLFSDVKEIPLIAKKSEDNILKSFEILEVPQDSIQKRESLGILHDSQVKEETDVNFLINPEDVFTVKDGTIVHNLQRSITLNPSAYNAFKMFDPNAPSVGKSDTFEPKNTFQKLKKEKLVMDKLKVMFSKYNRHVIWNGILSFVDNLAEDFQKLSICKQNDSLCKISNDDIARLQYIHVQQELQTLKNKNVVEELIRMINKRKENITMVLIKKGNSQDNIDCQMDIFNEHLEEVGLDSLISAMKREIASAKPAEDNDDLQIILSDILMIKGKIIDKKKAIDYYKHAITYTLNITKKVKEETASCVVKLSPFVLELACWSAPLKANLNSAEIQAFKDFPLEFNRRFTFIESTASSSNVFFRDIPNIMPFEIELNSRMFHLLKGILKVPFQPPETIVLDVLRAKKRQDIIKPLASTSISSFDTEIYSLEVLKSQESYLQPILDRLYVIIYHSISEKVLSTKTEIKKILEIWKDRPFINFVSPKTTIDGKEYKFYEKQYLTYYNNLKLFS